MGSTQNQKNTEQSVNFSSFLTSVLALAGATIGIGNFWRFPYMMGSHGGSAFLLIFLLFLFLVGIPAVIAEFTMARLHRKSTIAIFYSLYGRLGFIGGHIVVLGLVLMSTYYSLVVGNIFYAAIFSVVWGVNSDTLDIFSEGLKNNSLQFVISLVTIWLSILIVYLGIRSGIERCSIVIVPMFYIIIVYLIFVVLSQPGAIDHLRGFLVPDFSKIGFKEVFAALGQCFYSLALGGLVLVAYGRHLRADSNLPGMGFSAAFSDTAASILTSLFIVPAVLIFALQLDSGPTLLFETLPRIFSKMFAGEILAALALWGMALMAVLSLVGALQFIFEALADISFWTRLGRVRLLLLIGAVISVISVVPAFKPGALATMDLVIGSSMPILGSLFLIVGMMWYSDKRVIIKEIYGVRSINVFNRIFLFWLKWVIPVILIVILAGTLYEVLYN